jgi:hypothetical protein
MQGLWLLFESCMSVFHINVGGASFEFLFDVDENCKQELLHVCLVAGCVFWIRTMVSYRTVGKKYGLSLEN